ncbi:MAG: hypothetical protein NZM43_12790 [Saprospiraceae bacterium]|nr:hypothetical protein [Saprospiraceae bacterium]MDW8485190.1 hypothetical protein [Saprospiraceae bacterium]
MTRKFLWAVLLLSALYSCEPPTCLRVADKNTPRDSGHYVGIAKAISTCEKRSCWARSKLATAAPRSTAIAPMRWSVAR